MPNRKACFGEFELDLVRFELRRNGQAVRLEGRPLQLLIFLVEHSCQLVTREQIADALWGKDVFVDVETGINTAIRKVRVALEDDSTQPRYLQTVVGRGYRGCVESSSRDRKSTRLNSSHVSISYAVFCLKKKTQYILLCCAI